MSARPIWWIYTYTLFIWFVDISCIFRISYIVHICIYYMKHVCIWFIRMIRGYIIDIVYMHYTVSYVYRITEIDPHDTGIWYSQLQIGCHRILRIFLKTFNWVPGVPRLIIYYLVLLVNPMGRILVCWFVFQIISRFSATLSAIGCRCIMNYAYIALPIIIHMIRECVTRIIYHEWINYMRYIIYHTSMHVILHRVYTHIRQTSKKCQNWRQMVPKQKNHPTRHTLFECAKNSYRRHIEIQ